MKACLLALNLCFSVMLFGVEPLAKPELVHSVTPQGFQGEGGAVEIPARVGCALFCVPGIFVVFPLVCVRSPTLLFLHSEEVFRYSVLQTKYTFGRLGYYLLGTPPYLMKKTLWDGPLYLWDSAFSDPAVVKTDQPEPSPAQDAALPLPGMENKMAVPARPLPRARFIRGPGRAAHPVKSEPRSPP